MFTKENKSQYRRRHGDLIYPQRTTIYEIIFKARVHLTQFPFFFALMTNSCRRTTK